jgi:hypothetical protein
MKTSRVHSTSAQATVASTLLGVAFAAALTTMMIGSAIGQENDRHRQHNPVQTRSSHQERQHGDDQRYRRAEHSYGYADPAYVYAPPPVVYEPRPSPGISLFFKF